MTRRILALLLVVTMVGLMVAGCGIRKKIGEGITEQLLEGAAGDDVDVEIDGDEISIEGENGESITTGSTKWPEGEVGKAIPKLDKGTIDFVLESDTGITVNLTGIEQADYDAYVEELKSAGYDVEAGNMDTDTGSMYWASNEDGIALSVTYDAESTTAFIMASVPTE